jgi:hypothetical protein
MERGDRLAAGMGMLWLAVFPLYNDLSYAHITHGKWVGMLALLIFTAALAIITAAVLTDRHALRTTVRLSPAQALALMYFAWVTLSAFEASCPARSTRRGRRPYGWARSATRDWPRSCATRRCSCC